CDRWRRHRTKCTEANLVSEISHFHSRLWLISPTSEGADRIHGRNLRGRWSTGRVAATRESRGPARKLVLDHSEQLHGYTLHRSVPVDEEDQCRAWFHRTVASCASGATMIR